MKLIQGDCLQILKQISDGSADIVLADPPYCSGGMTITERKKSTAEKYQRSDTQNKYFAYQGDSRDQRSALLWGALWLSECWRIAKDGGHALIFCDWRQIANTVDMLQAGGFVYRGIVVWDKGNNTRPQANRFKAQAEFVIWGTKGDAPNSTPTPNSKYLAGVYQYSAPPSQQREHANQKPVELLEKLMEIHDGGVVIDPFMGSGSTGVACVNTGRDFIGIELDPGYFETAQRRIQEAQERAEMEAAQMRIDMAM